MSTEVKAIEGRLQNATDPAEIKALQIALAHSKKRGPVIGYVYFVHGPITRLVKIGYTLGDPLVRLAGMQTDSPDILRLVGVIRCENPAIAEHGLHAEYAEYRVHGEWFRDVILVSLESVVTEYLHEPIVTQDRASAHSATAAA